MMHVAHIRECYRHLWRKRRSAVTTQFFSKKVQPVLQNLARNLVRNNLDQPIAILSHSRYS